MLFYPLEVFKTVRETDKRPTQAAIQAIVGLQTRIKASCRACDKFFYARRQRRFRNITMEEIL